MASDPECWTVRAHPAHPRGLPSLVTMTVNRNLASGRVDTVSLTEDDTVTLLAQLAEALSIVRRVNRERSTGRTA